MLILLLILLGMIVGFKDFEMFEKNKLIALWICLISGNLKITVSTKKLLAKSR